MFDLDKGIEEKCEDTIARAIMEKVKDTDLLCETIVVISTMLSNEDKQWLVNNISQFITKPNT